MKGLEIGGKDFESIIIANSNDEVIAIITDEEIVEHEDYKVILEPAKEE